MKNISVALLTLALVISSSLLAKAGSIYFTGDVGFLPFTKQSGTMNVMIDLEPGHTMQNGGVTLTIDMESPNVFVFTDATVLNPGNRWTIAADTTTPAQVQFNAASVLSPALPPGGQGVHFATINWAWTGSGRRSDLHIEMLPETFVNGPDGDVTGQYTAVDNFLFYFPEPTSLTMCGLGLIGLILRRRNG